MSRIYITTAIPYVNGLPHIGHALELVQVDALARAWRVHGDEVRTLTGTDDNALKNVQAAERAGVPVAEFVRQNGDEFIALAGPLGLSFDDVIRTSSDPRHRVGVERLWRACKANGDIYLSEYTGHYCVGCEAFVDDDELDAAGRCPEHHTIPELVSETNWFFRLSRYGDVVRRAIDSGDLTIEPRVRANEVLGLLRAGLRDVSVSRSVERSRGWGIPVPDDPTQVIYVWFDALANYVTALATGDDEEHWWRDSDQRIHVIGKGIIRFHALYWPAILASAGLRLPTTLFVHDYLTVDGVKIAKSAGNGVSPSDLVSRFGTDAVRWWLLSNSPLGADSDFTVDRLIERANNDLANGFGNLVSRTVTLVNKLRHGSVGAARSLEPDAEYLEALRVYDLRRAARRIVALVDDANRELEEDRPWELARHDPSDPRIDTVLDDVVSRCRHITRLIAPFVPETATRATELLGSGRRVGPRGRVFDRLEIDGFRSRDGRAGDPGEPSGPSAAPAIATTP
jgi:methionyl-tRNA synthetase